MDVTVNFTQWLFFQNSLGKIQLKRKVLIHLLCFSLTVSRDGGSPKCQALGSIHASVKTPLLFLSLYQFSCNIAFEEKMVFLICHLLSPTSLNSTFSIFHPLSSLSCSAQPLLVTHPHLFYTRPSSPLEGQHQYEGASVCFPLCCISSTMKHVGHVVGFKKQALFGNISVCTGCQPPCHTPIPCPSTSILTHKQGDGPCRSILILSAHGMQDNSPLVEERRGTAPPTVVRNGWFSLYKTLKVPYLVNGNVCHTLDFRWLNEELHI